MGAVGVRSSRPIVTDVVAVCDGCDWELLAHEAAPGTIAEAARWHAYQSRHRVRVSRTTVRTLVRITR